MSAALYNHKMIRKPGRHKIPMMGLKRTVGYVFNQTMVETNFSKCSYIFDGATQNRLNGGCALGGGMDCSQKNAAYYNICPSTQRKCTANDEWVKKAECALWSNGSTKRWQ